MRKIRIAEHISLDGVIEPDAPAQSADYAHGGWTAPYRTAEGARAVADAQGERFDLLLGRRTYDLWAAFWPTVKDGPFAHKLNAATKYVATHRPEGLAWGPVQPLGPDALAGIGQLRAQDGPELLVCGSGSLVAPLLERGWVDELVLIVYPLLLGQGKRCLPTDTGPQAMSLASSSATPTGVLVNIYRRVDAAAPAAASR